MPAREPTVVSNWTIVTSVVLFAIIVIILLFVANNVGEPSKALVGWTDWLTKVAGAVVAILGILTVVASYTYAKVTEQDTRAKEQRVNQVLAAAKAKHAGLSEDDVNRVLQVS